VTLLLLLALLQEKPQPVTDPEKAGPDFKVQGEYEGGGDRGRFGLQIVALGDGKFTGWLLGGGLPGAGWDGKFRARLSEQSVRDGAVQLKTPQNVTKADWCATIKASDADIQTDDLGTSTLKRVVRKSATEGAQPPEGAVVLFDGKNADEWEKGKVVEGNLLYCGTKTKKTFRDVKLHVEFRMSWGPRWPDRSNSGVYLMGCHEVQIIDSFGKDDPGTGDCGGIYETAKPKINMCTPPLQWQTFDIEYRAPRWENGKKVKNAVMSVDHNGVRIHENVEVPKATRANILPEVDAPGPVHLQDHGSPVVFRNIWLVELK
jgi:hypothetical protein